MAKYSSPGVYRKERDISDIITPAGTSKGGIVVRATKGPINRPVLVTSNKDYIDTFGYPIFISGSNGDGVTPELGYGPYAALEFLKESDTLYVVRDYATGDKYATSVWGSNGSISATSATGIQSISNPNGDPDTIDEIYTLDQAIPTGNVLLVGALGPGAEGNNIAVTLETFHSACDWFNSYDTYTSSTAVVDHPIGRYVFKVSVYTKETEESWDSLTFANYSASPVEVFYGTRTAMQDSNKQQLLISEVVNGISKYIYVVPGSTDFTSGCARALTPTSVTPLSGGACVYGTNINTTDGWSYFNNREDVSVDILICPDYSTTVKQYVSNIASNRQDCIAVVQSGNLSATTVNLILDGPYKEVYGYRNPSYTALYGGWDQIYDGYNDKKVWVPKCIFGAALMARTDSVSAPWVAPAGINRGIISSLKQNKYWSQAEIGQLYEKNINTSRFVNGVGDVMWGQKTAQLKKSALDRINVRRLLLYIENSIEPSLLSFLFQPNTASTRLRVWNIVDSFLATVQSGEGLYNYKVVCDETNNTAEIIDRNEMLIQIYLKPSIAIEFITLETIITRSGAQFNEVV